MIKELLTDNTNLIELYLTNNNDNTITSLNIDKNIITIEVIGDVLHINYDDTSMEILELSEENYKKMYELWFKEVPMFISDKHKEVIKSLNFVKINKDKLNNMSFLNNYFKDVEKAKLFFNYMKIRKNKILNDKKAWNYKDKK